MAELVELTPSASLADIDVVVPLEVKLRLCRQLREAGFARVEVTRLRSGVPQFQDGLELLSALAREPGGWRAAVWDREGAEQAVAAGCREVVVTVSSAAGGLFSGPDPLALDGSRARQAGLALAYLRPRLVRAVARVEEAFGRREEPPERSLERLLGLADWLVGAGAEEMSLATCGGGVSPEHVTAFYEAVHRRFPGLPLSLQIGGGAGSEGTALTAAAWLAKAYAAGARVFEVATAPTRRRRARAFATAGLSKPSLHSTGVLSTRQALAWLARVGEPMPVRPETLGGVEVTVAVAASRWVRPAGIDAPLVWEEWW